MADTMRLVYMYKLKIIFFEPFFNQISNLGVVHFLIAICCRK